MGRAGVFSLGGRQSVVSRRKLAPSKPFLITFSDHCPAFILPISLGVVFQVPSALSGMLSESESENHSVLFDCL